VADGVGNRVLVDAPTAAGERHRSTAVGSTLICFVVVRHFTMARGMLRPQIGLDGTRLGWTALDWTGRAGRRCKGKGPLGWQCPCLCSLSSRPRQTEILRPARRCDMATPHCRPHCLSNGSALGAASRHSYNNRNICAHIPRSGFCSSSPQKAGTRQSRQAPSVVLLQAAGSNQVWRRWRVIGVQVTSKK
jgi:hypothetical protein